MTSRVLFWPRAVPLPVGAAAGGRRLLAALLALLTAAAMLPLSAGQVAAAPAPRPVAGPIDPDTGYPLWYEDRTGLRLGLCLDRPATGLCLAELADPARPPFIAEDAADTNFPADPEAFWWAADASIDRPGGGKALLVLAKEAAFGGAAEQPIASEQVTFGRVRVVIDQLVPGASYRVVHPYGVDEFVAEDRDGDEATTGDGVVRVTEDIGCFDLPCDFEQAATSRVTSYLRWLPGEAPDGYVGDPNVPHRVTGSPYRTNYFRVEGPNVGGPGVDAIETDLFNIQGKLWRPQADTPILGMVSSSNVVDFGRVTPGASAESRDVVLTNAGTAPLTFARVALEGEGVEAFTLSGDCGATVTVLEPGQECALQVGFSPAALGGHQVRLAIDSDAVDSPHRIVVRGRGSDGTDPAELRQAGPIDLAHGFPMWYADEKGTRLAICLDPADDLCLPQAEPYDPANGPLAFPHNFPHEAFWWAAAAGMDTNSDEDASLVLAHEAAFLNEEPLAGDQMVFGRVRIRIGGLRQGETYTVTHPYGVETFVAEQGGPKGVNMTDDQGCFAAPCDFTKALDSRVGPFLTWNPEDGPLPDGYIGDPNNDRPVTGSPLGPEFNVFRVEGPGVYAPEGDDDPNGEQPPADGCPTVDGPLSDCVESTIFSVAGKQWRAPAEATLALLESKGSADFGGQPLDSRSEPKTLRLTNVGQAPLQITELGVAGVAATDFEIVDDPCTGTTLATDAVCTVGVVFKPSGEVGGSRNAELTIASDAPAGAAAVRLHGIARMGDEDLRRPTAPDLDSASDTGASSRDDITADTTPLFSGAAAIDAPVELIVRDGDRLPVATTAASVAAGGVYAVELPDALPDGVYAVSARVTDAAGTTVESLPTTVTVDTTGPAAPAAPTLEVVDGTVTADPVDGTVTGDPAVDGTATGDPGTGGDATVEPVADVNLTEDPTPAVVGSVDPAETGATVEILSGDLVVGSGVADAAGAYRIVVGPLTDGEYDLRARLVDVAGNVGDTSVDALRVTIEAVPPVVVIDAAPPATTEVSDVELAFSSEPGATFECSLVTAGTPDAFAPCVSPAAYGPLRNGDYAFAVRAIDGFGHIGPAAVHTFTVAAPVPTVAGAADTDRFSPNTDGRLERMTVTAAFSKATSWTFTIRRGATVVYSAAGVGTAAELVWNGRSNAGNRVPDGAYTWTLDGSDAAGNPVAEPLTGSVVVDTRAPALSNMRATPTTFNSRTQVATLRMTVSEAGTVAVRVLNRAGRAVATFPVRTLARAASPVFRWDGRNDAGAIVANGTYRFDVVATDLAGNSAGRRQAVTLRRL